MSLPHTCSLITCRCSMHDILSSVFILQLQLLVTVKLHLNALRSEFCDFRVFRLV